VVRREEIVYLLLTCRTWRYNKCERENRHSDSS